MAVSVSAALTSQILNGTVDLQGKGELQSAREVEVWDVNAVMANVMCCSDAIFGSVCNANKQNGKDSQSQVQNIKIIPSLR